MGLGEHRKELSALMKPVNFFTIYINLRVIFFQGTLCIVKMSLLLLQEQTYLHTINIRKVLAVCFPSNGMEIHI